jgi:hypothetical protein
VKKDDKVSPGEPPKEDKPVDDKPVVKKEPKPEKDNKDAAAAPKDVEWTPDEEIVDDGKPKYWKGDWNEAFKRYYDEFVKSHQRRKRSDEEKSAITYLFLGLFAIICLIVIDLWFIMDDKAHKVTPYYLEPTENELKKAKEKDDRAKTKSAAQEPSGNDNFKSA